MGARAWRPTPAGWRWRCRGTRQGSFDPLLIAKYQRRFPGFDDKTVSMYARGMSTREIAGHLLDLYGVEVSADLISTVTDAVLDEIDAWQARPLEPVYPLVFFDALRVKIRDEGLVYNEAVHALGVRADGTKEILGMWLEQNEVRVRNELRNRGVEDILLAVVDDLKGFPEAILAALPEPQRARPDQALPPVDEWPCRKDEQDTQGSHRPAHHYGRHDDLRGHLALFLDVYSYARRLKTLNGLTPYEFICRS
jgi:hypothetical protein